MTEAWIGAFAAVATLVVSSAKDHSEALLAATGSAALGCCLLAGAAAIAGWPSQLGRRYRSGLGRAGMLCGLAHVAVFCIESGSPAPDVWLSAASEKPFVLPGLAALAVLTAMTLGAGFFARSPRLRRLRGSLGDAVLLLTSLHLIAGSEPTALTLGAAVGCLALVGLRSRRRATASKIASLATPAHARRIVT